MARVDREWVRVGVEWGGVWWSGVEWLGGESYMTTDEDLQGSNLDEESLSINAVDDSVDGLAFEWSPDDGAVEDGKLG